MEVLTTRPARREDIGDICRVWEACFGDAPETVEKLLEPETLENTVVAVIDGRTRALMTAFDGLNFGGVPTSYIFALCTGPGFRARGLGRRVLLETSRRAFERGADLVCLHPASESLARWYAGLGLKTLSRVSYETARAGETGPPSLRSVSAEEYAVLRADAPPEVPGGLLRAQELFYSGAEGGFFVFDGGCVCIQSTENGAEIRELLCPERQRAGAAAAVSERFGCAVRLPRVLPADSEHGNTHLMGLWKNGVCRSLAQPPYLPFLLD